MYLCKAHYYTKEVSKPLQKLIVIITAFVLTWNITNAQGGTYLVANVGIGFQFNPTADLSLQLRSYWLFDSAQSNTGPGIGCEANFNNSTSVITLGPKLFYQADIFMGRIGKNKSVGLYVVGRLSLIRYTNKEGNDYRLTPEAGLSLYDIFTVLYGYNVPLPFSPDRLSEISGNRITLVLTFGGKKK